MTSSEIEKMLQLKSLQKILKVS